MKNAEPVRSATLRVVPSGEIVMRSRAGSSTTWMVPSGSSAKNGPWPGSFTRRSCVPSASKTWIRLASPHVSFT
jgi:hypothetical protein